MNRSLTLKDKRQLVLNSDIELGEQEGNGKGRYFMSRFIEPGIAHYEELGDILITKETLNKFIQTMVGVPVIIDHEDVTDKNVDKLRVGSVSKVWFNEFDGYFYCEGILTDPEAIDLVKNQGWNVSCAYSFQSVPKDTHNGKKIDMEFIDGEFLHLAIVKNPRYEGANIVVNKNDDVEWITVKGNHIPVKKGQSKDEAVKEFLKDKEGKKEEKKKEYDLDTTLEMKIDSHYEDDIISEQYEKEMSELLGTKITAEDIYSAMEKAAYRPESGDYDISKMREELKKIAKDKKKKQKELDKEREASKKQSLVEYDLKHMLQGIDRNADYRYDAERKTLEVRYFGKWEGDDGSGDYDWQHPSEDTVQKVREVKEQFKKRFGYELSSDWGEKNWYYFKIKENKTNNSIGDITMTVLNDLTDFIKKVVKNEKDEEEMKEVKNEDKRKLIDEVGGILKGKVDDEIIKTVMKKMEEASYEPSEDDKTDNEDDKEKEAKNKCKNEDDEKDEKVTENEDEDKKEDKKEEADNEEEKKEEKKEVKNSMKDIVMGGNGQAQEQKLYISRKERLEEGNKY